MPKSMKSKTHHNHLFPLQTSGATTSSRRENTESQSSSPRVTTHWTPSMTNTQYSYLVLKEEERMDNHMHRVAIQATINSLCVVSEKFDICIT
jgi:hypothetical protein